MHMAPSAETWSDGVCTLSRFAKQALWESKTGSFGRQDRRFCNANPTVSPCTDNE